MKRAQSSGARPKSRMGQTRRSGAVIRESRSGATDFISSVSESTNHNSLAVNGRRETHSGTREAIRVGSRAAIKRELSPAAERALERRRRRLANEAANESAKTNRSMRARRLGVLDYAEVAPTRWRDHLNPKRIPFVVVVIGFVLVGLTLTLYLTATSAAHSYQISQEKRREQALLDQRSALKRQAEAFDAAPELADRAAKLGMIPATNVPRLVIGRNGKSRLSGPLLPATGFPGRNENRNSAPSTRVPSSSPTVGNNQPLPSGVPETSGATPPRINMGPNVLPKSAAPTANNGNAR